MAIDVSFTVVPPPAYPLKDVMNACINAIKLLVNKEAVVTVNCPVIPAATARMETILTGVKTSSQVSGRALHGFGQPGLWFCTRRLAVV